MKTSEKRKSYPVIKTLKKLIDNVTTKNPKLYLIFVVYTFAAGIYPFFSVLLPKFVLQELSKDNLANIETILMITITYFVVVSLFGFVKTFLKDYSYPRLSYLRIGYVGDTSKKLMQMAYCHMEDATFLQKWDKAFKATSNNDEGLEGVYHKLFETPAILLTVSVLAIMIGLLNPLVLIMLVVNMLAILWIRRQVHQYQFSRKEESAKWLRKVKYYSDVTHDFGYGKDIRIYGLKDRILDNYTKEIEGYTNVQKLIEKKEYLLGFVGLAALFISDITTYYILVNKAMNGLSIADFSMYLGAIATLSLLLKTVAENFGFILNETEYVYEFFQLMDADIGEKGGTLPAITNETLEIEFKDVSFKYPGTDNYIFRNLNFTIHKGERLAIVGINGAGKSTLVKLMTGLFDVTDGEILINNIPLVNFNRQELYKMFSVVFQEVNVLAYTIRENIACQSEGVDESRLDSVLEQVGLYNKVMAYPKQKDQLMLKVIEEDGVLMSGGESQKLSIARALYKDANMIIMDEPTAALDALAEAEIYENFSELVQGKTAVYISHRLTSTKFCDKIALFDNDGLKEYGNHDELMALKGEYFHMFSVQGKYYKEGSANNE